MNDRLAAAAVRGSLWLGLVNLLSKSSQILVTLVLAAWFSEGELGVVTLVVAVVNIGQVVQSMGVYDLISRTEREPRRMAGTVLTLSVGTAGALAVVVLLVAEPAAAALGAPAAAPLLGLAALSLPFSAAGGVQMGLMHRDLDFRKRLLPDAGGAVLGAAVTVVLAALGDGPRALVLGLLCAAVAQPVLGVLVGVRVRFRWEPAAVTEAVRWIAVVGPAAIVAILLVNVDYLLLGHLLGADAVGRYSLAYRIAWVPYITVAIVLGAVAFPVYSKLIRTGCREELPTAVSRFTRAVLVLTGGLYLLAAVLGDRVVLLGERWAPAAGPLVALCFYGLAISLLHGWYEAIRATGRTRLYLALQAGHLLVLVVMLVLLTRHGVLAAAVAQAVAAWLLVPVTWWALVRLDLAQPLPELGGTAARVVLAGLVAGGGVVLLDRSGFFGPPTSITGSCVAAVVLLLGYTAVSLAAHRGAVRELRDLRHTTSGGRR
ncbi:oligosaccharide flippase family protein [Amycolatopsis magusensis]|uniref:PST family polysaccharide transporter n=1 Tax=Amycolatopsis magusensis TaxID=882444 RepID=A0ABS4PT72_9PSEU|nr:oligosaccharide flippase family protein [Amycolatopsis magusensis]MBP2182624.1 PST family polysaccharide transporter [Amycolatopsis magusensis]